MSFSKYLFLLCPFLLLAQERPFQFGLTAGVPLTSGTRLQTDQSKRYTIGGFGEYRFTDHISLVVNPMYRRTGSDGVFNYQPDPSNPNQTQQISSLQRDHNLDLPIFGRYTFLAPTRKWRPFVNLGFSLNHSFRRVEGTVLNRNLATGESKSETFRGTSTSVFYTGVLVGAGLDYRFAKFHVLPEFRYNYHGSYNPTNRRPNQVDFLLSFRF